jgi:hypothetical protein
MLRLIVALAAVLFVAVSPWSEVHAGGKNKRQDGGDIITTPTNPSGGHVKTFSGIKSSPGSVRSSTGGSVRSSTGSRR